MGNLDFSANADQLKELAAYMASQINVPTIGIGGGYAPLGTINFFDATVAPQDWLACDGSVYNIADYPQLAEWYATQHGASNFYGGNGTTTFAVPDLQGEFLRGTGTNSHTNQGSGANVGVHQDGTEIPFMGYDPVSGSYGNIWRTSNHYESTVEGTTNSPKEADSIKNDSNAKLGAFSNYQGTFPSTGNYAYTSRPTNTSFLICVKAVMAGEVYSTEERVVGTWIDGKKIYQKTVEYGAAPNNRYLAKAHNISNIDQILNIKGYGYDSTDQVFVTIPSLDVDVVGAGINCMASKTEIGMKSKYDKSNVYFYITLQYTKTV